MKTYTYPRIEILLLVVQVYWIYLCSEKENFYAGITDLNGNNYSKCIKCTHSILTKYTVAALKV